MIATLIIIGIALAWLGYETDWLSIRLESTEYQHQQLNRAQVKAEFSNNADMPEDSTPYRPSEFTPLDMPEMAGTLNIVCERG